MSFNRTLCTGTPLGPSLVYTEFILVWLCRKLLAYRHTFESISGTNLYWAMSVKFLARGNNDLPPTGLAPIWLAIFDVLTTWPCRHSWGFLCQNVAKFYKYLQLHTHFGKWIHFIIKIWPKLSNKYCVHLQFHKKGFTVNTETLICTFSALSSIHIHL